MAKWIDAFPAGWSKPVSSVDESTGISVPRAESTDMNPDQLGAWLGMTKEEAESWFRRTAGVLGGVAHLVARRNGDHVDITITAKNVPMLNSPAVPAPSAPAEDHLKRIERIFVERIEQLERQLAASQAREAEARRERDHHAGRVGSCESKLSGLEAKLRHRDARVQELNAQLRGRDHVQAEQARKSLENALDASLQQAGVVRGDGVPGSGARIDRTTVPLWRVTELDGRVWYANGLHKPSNARELWGSDGWTVPDVRR